MGGISPLGSDWQTVRHHLKTNKSAVKTISQWEDIEGLNATVGAPVSNFEIPSSWPRRQRRSMGRVSAMSVMATHLALSQAGLLDDPILNSGRAGISYGSSSGSFDSYDELADFYANRTTRKFTSNSYIKVMPHTSAAAIGIFFGITGRIIPSSTACTSGSLAIGMAYENIASGKQDVMIAGGADELHELTVAVFDTLMATSTRNDAPSTTPRPFDQDRDGLVVGEGACTFVLESLDHAMNRDAVVLGEIIGFATNSDGRHLTRPSGKTVTDVMKLALQDAEIQSNDVGYVSAHGTATEIGDVVESVSTFEVFGGSVPISSLKSYMGHTMGACGALEAWMSIQMLKEGWVAPTLNLDNVDAECAPLNYVREKPLPLKTKYFINNNFAFGGVNTSIVFAV